jgi:hypothetical protein
MTKKEQKIKKVVNCKSKSSKQWNSKT